MCPHNSQGFLFVPDVVQGGGSGKGAGRNEARARNQLALRLIVQLWKLGILLILLARLAACW